MRRQRRGSRASSPSSRTPPARSARRLAPPRTRGCSRPPKCYNVLNACFSQCLASTLESGVAVPPAS
eukprot:15329369-Alexandrium_andersonii.AAC.1